MSMRLFYSIMVVLFFFYSIACLSVDDIDGMRYGVIVCLLCSILQKEYEA